MFDKAHLPDVASHDTSPSALPLDWVGMEAIALPFAVPDGEGQSVPVTAMADSFVSLDAPDSKGIHMSRLYLQLKDRLAHKTLSSELLTGLLQDMVVSQEGISQNAKVRLTFDLPLEKPALLSGETGIQAYTVALTASLVRDALTQELALTIPYSSTCPCSAALSRQAIATAINNNFDTETIDKGDLLAWLQSEAGSVATPHSQRSFAYINLTFADGIHPDIAALIWHFEAVMGTPVQTAVKRQDEQAFAKLNAQNLMFCEDAARRLKNALEAMPEVHDYAFKVEHQESLHAHNAVAMDRKRR